MRGALARGARQPGGRHGPAGVCCWLVAAVEGGLLNDAITNPLGDWGPVRAQSAPRARVAPSRERPGSLAAGMAQPACAVGVCLL